MDIVAIVAALLNLLALGGFFWYVKGWFTSLEKIVGVQKEAIDAYQKLLESADVPKMAERMVAYKKFVDQEKEALQEDYERKLSEHGEAPILRGAELADSQRVDDFELVAALLPHVQPERRKAIIDSSPISGNLKAITSDVALKAPYLPPNPSLTLQDAFILVRDLPLTAKQRTIQGWLRW